MIFKEKKATFDRSYRRIKRKHMNDKMLQIRSFEKCSPREFWDALKKLGPRKKSADLPAELLLHDGSLSSNPNTVLGEWHNHFCSIFDNSMNDQGYDDELREYIVQKKIRV